METFKLYYYAGAQPVALRVLTASNGQGAVYYIHTDHLGSTGKMTNAARQVVQAAYYEPFGRVRGVSTASGLVTSEPASYLNNRTFTGQYRESAAAMGSLMHYGARQYSPYLGRMISGDAVVPGPFNPQALNRYSYALNQPTVYVDQTGHCAGPVGVACLAAVGVVVVIAIVLITYIIVTSPAYQEAVRDAAEALEDVVVAPMPVPERVVTVPVQPGPGQGRQPTAVPSPPAMVPTSDRPGITAVIDSNVLMSRPGGPGALEAAATLLRNRENTLFIPQAAFDEVTEGGFSQAALEALAGNGARIVITDDPKLTDEMDSIIFGNFGEVDAKVVELARQMGLPLYTANRAMVNQINSVPSRKAIWGDVPIFVLGGP